MLCVRRLLATAKKRHNEWREQERKLKRQKNLHPAGKYKRVLSQCDYWFKASNLVNDRFLVMELAAHNGWCRLSTLSSFPRFKYWGTPNVLAEAFAAPGAERYDLDGDMVRPRVLRDYAPSGLTLEEASDDDLASLHELLGGFEDDISRWKREDVVDVLTSDDEILAELAIQSNAWVEALPLAFQDVGRREELREICDDFEYDLLDNVDEAYCDEDIVDLGFAEFTDRFGSPEARRRTIEDARFWKRIQGMDIFNELLASDPATARQCVAVALRRMKTNKFERLAARFASHHLASNRDSVVKSIERHMYRRNSGFRIPIPTVNPFAFGEIIEHVGSRTRLRRHDKEDATDVWDDDFDVSLRDEVDDEALLKTARKSLPRFTHGAAIHVASSPRQVEATVAALRQSVGSDTSIGFDVEYATLETDLRMLPAMVQLATLDYVVLVWLDKLPDHGARELHPDRPLGALLADPSLVKVGNGARADAANLEAYSYGVLRTQSVHDLAFERATSLAELVQIFLGKNLPKRKVALGRNSKAGKAASKKAHWRAAQLTTAMRRYAADDAVASLAVWRAMNQHDPS